MQGIRRPDNYRFPCLCFSYVASRLRQAIPANSSGLLAGRVPPEVGIELAGGQHLLAASQVGIRDAGAAANSGCRPLRSAAANSGCRSKFGMQQLLQGAAIN